MASYKHIRNVGLIMMACALIAPAIAQPNPQPVFDQANEVLQQGEIKRALELYRSLESRQNVSGALFLNMGISYTRIDSLGMAKYYFLKASRFEKTREQAQQGIEYVESHFSRLSAVLPKLPWEKAVDWLREHIEAVNLLLMAVIFFNAGVLLYVLGWFVELKINQRINWWASRTAISLAGLGLAILLLSFYVEYVDNRYGKAVMVHNKTSVFEHPSPDASLISQAYEGYNFTVDHRKSRNKEGWSYVRLSNGLYGWISNEDILIL